MRFAKDPSDPLHLMVTGSLRVSEVGTSEKRKGPGITHYLWNGPEPVVRVVGERPGETVAIVLFASRTCLIDLNSTDCSLVKDTSVRLRDWIATVGENDEGFSQGEQLGEERVPSIIDRSAVSSGTRDSILLFIA